MPQNDAGWRIEPPVSVPVAPIASRAATAAAEPPDEPPGTSTAVVVLPPLPRVLHRADRREVMLDEPMANSSMLALPRNTAPSRSRLALTVLS